MAIVATAATFASAAIEMMKESGSDQKRWEAGFLLWTELLQGQRSLMASISHVSDQLSDAMSLIQQIPGETVIMSFSVEAINVAHSIERSPTPDSQQYRDSRRKLLSHASGLRGLAIETTLPRVAVAAARSLSGIESVISIEKLSIPVADDDVRKAVEGVEFACRSLTTPGSKLSDFMREYDVRIAAAKERLVADPLYTKIIPKLPEPIPDSVETAGLSVGNEDRCWVKQLNDVRGREDLRHGPSTFLGPGPLLERRVMYEKRTQYRGDSVSVLLKPVYGGQHYLEIAHRPVGKWRNGVWSRDVDHRVTYHPLTRESSEEHVEVRSDSRSIIEKCIPTEFSKDGYPIRLAELNAKLETLATLIAAKSVLVGLRDLSTANIRRCRQLLL